MFTGVVPGPPAKPSGAQSTKTKTSAAPGRKVTASKQKPPENPPPKKKRGAATMDELDRMLEDDHLAMLSMKKEIGAAQKREIAGAGKEMMKLQKEHDAIKMANDIKERELANINDSIKQLGTLENDALNKTLQVNDEVTAIKNGLGKVNQDVEAEQRTLKMLTLISKRLTDEIAATRVETSGVQFDIDLVKHELIACESTIGLSKQELAVQEKQVSNLNSVTKARREDRTSKIKQLRKIVDDGEQSANFVKNQSIHETGTFDVSLYALCCNHDTWFIYIYSLYVFCNLS